MEVTSRRPRPTGVVDEEWEFLAPYLTLMTPDAADVVQAVKRPGRAAGGPAQSRSYRAGAYSGGMTRLRRPIRPRGLPCLDIVRPALQGHAVGELVLRLEFGPLDGHDPEPTEVPVPATVLAPRLPLRAVSPRPKAPLFRQVPR